MTRATIIITTHNAAEYLRPTLTSLMGQTAGEYDVLMVDDGSTDQTITIAEQFQGPRLRIIEQAHHGHAAARNTGISEARGEYIAFCEAGDIWAPQKLSMHLSHLDEEQDVGISFAGASMIGDEGQPLNMEHTPRLTSVSAAYLFKQNPLSYGASPVIRASALDDIAFRPENERSRNWWFNENMRHYFDRDAWLRLMTNTDWIVEGVPGQLVQHRIEDEALGVPSKEQMIEWQTMVRRLSPTAPAFFARHSNVAKAMQKREVWRNIVESGEEPAARSEAPQKSLSPAMSKAFGMGSSSRSAASSQAISETMDKAKIE